MHYKDGTPAKLGDIVQHDAGHVGIVIGGMIGSDTCSTQVVRFNKPGKEWSGRGGAGYIGTLVDEKGEVVAQAGISITHDLAMQTRECLKIGHIDIGHD